MNTIQTRRAALKLGLGFGVGSLLMPRRAEAEQPPVIVELFTSQGCSSCPPADLILGGLKQLPGVYPVSMNVDYWDYLGWRDTLAKPEYSKRQFDYGKSRGDMKVYTPQAVVNGRYHAVGSDRKAIEALIAKARAEAPLLPLSLRTTKTEIEVEIPEAEVVGEATLWLMAIAAEKSQVVEHGENAGSTLVYHNVVRNLVPAAMWDGRAFAQKWTKEAVMMPDCAGCLAVLQQGMTGPVLGVADWGPTFS